MHCLLLPLLASGNPVRSETNKSSIGKVFTFTVIQNDKKVYASFRIPLSQKKHYGAFDFGRKPKDFGNQQFGEKEKAGKITEIRRNIYCLP